MKKMMMVALMAIVASTAFAGDSDALKSILKAKTYAEAESLLKSNLGQLASASEKAKAYNKLIDLALDKVAKEQAVITNNQLAEQMKQGKVEQYDTVGFYNALAQAFDAAEECEKYDKMPNEKGKVKPAFHAKNVQRLIGYRQHFINGGIFYQNKNDLKTAFKYLATYVDSHDSPLFAEEAAKTADDNLANMAYYAALFAFNNKDYKNVFKYADMAKADEKLAKDATNLVNAARQQTLQTRQDSIDYVKQLEADYAAAPDDEITFGLLLQMYNGLQMNDEMNVIIDKKLAVDPNNYTAWAVKGQNAMNAQNLEVAIESFKNALKQQPENVPVLSLLGACLIDRGAAAVDRAAGKTGRIAPEAKNQIRPVFEEAKSYLEKAKALDPDQLQSKWAYLLERVDYLLEGMK